MSDRARDAIAARFGIAFDYAPAIAHHRADVALDALDAAGLAVVDREVADLAAHADRLEAVHDVSCQVWLGYDAACDCDAPEARAALDRVRAREEANHV